MPTQAMDVTISLGEIQLKAAWTVPEKPRGVVLFAHGSGSSRFSPRNQFVAGVLQDAGFATLLMDLLDEGEAEDRAKVFDIDLLAERLTGAMDWVAQVRAGALPIGLFGASTGSAAALMAAARRPELVRAVVSRGGRPDLASNALPAVQAPTLLIVGARDPEVWQFNHHACRRLAGISGLRIVPKATHLFEEPGTLQQVAALAVEWFSKYLVKDSQPDQELNQTFRDRADAGRRLAARLKGRPFCDPLVLGIPRGGIVPASVLADALNAELDVVLARKLRMPGQPEFALGAISETGEVYLNVDDAGLPPTMKAVVDEECWHQAGEIRRRREIFRPGRSPACITGRSVIITDDGIATGSTMIAALRAVRGQNPLELIVAVPVATPDRLRQVQPECDEILCLIEAPDLHAVGQFYDDFTQVEDEVVVAALNRFAKQTSPA